MSIGSSADLLQEESTHDVVLELAGGEVAARSPRALFWRRFRADRVAMVSGVIVIVFVVIAIMAPLIVSIFGLRNPDAQNSNLLGLFGQATGPSGADPFGVDDLGRDVLSRVIYGLRISLEVGVFGTAIAAIIGTIVGLAAGYYGRWIDTVLMRLVDVFLAFPVIVLGLGIADACSASGCFKVGGTALIRPGLGTVMFIIALSSFTYIARIVRGQVLSIREKEFVEASRSVGASNRRTLTREILPNLTTPLVVYSSLLIPTNILLEAALSFLGVGIQPPTPSLGQMISAAGSDLLSGQPAWWQMVFPGAVLLLLVLAFNMLGDGLLDALD
jgi:ABC-type dipeptide/oligopeptide/nickel transport system permease subunit